ncbi:hypothetical protein AB205_0021440, partial [Aquarana catesbeiana]
RKKEKNTEAIKYHQKKALFVGKKDEIKSSRSLCHSVEKAEVVKIQRVICATKMKNCQNTIHTPMEVFYFLNSIGKYNGVLLDKTSRFSCRGKSIHNFISTSTFTEYTVLDEIAVAKIHEDAPLEKVCLIGCGFSTGYGSALNTGKATVAEDVNDEAPRTLRHFRVRTLLERRIIGVDLNSDKFAKAKECGATECINPKDYNIPIHEVLAKMTDDGVVYAFESLETLQ